MIIVGRSDKLVISRVEQIADTAYLPCHFVNIFFRGYACILGVLLYLLTVFIGTGKEKHIISLHSLIPGYGIGENYLIGIAYVRLARCVSNRSCDVILFFGHDLFSSSYVNTYILYHLFYILQDKTVPCGTVIVFSFSYLRQVCLRHRRIRPQQLPQSLFLCLHYRLRPRRIQQRRQ